MPRTEQTQYQWIDAILGAIGRVESMDFENEADRKTIYRCLRAELSEAIERRDAYEYTRNDGKRWTEGDVETLRKFLTGKRPTTWEEERAIVEEASAILSRSLKPVKKKAVEIGLGKAVDYWINRENKR